MNGVKPNKENCERFEQLREIGCIVCHLKGHGWSPAQIHHITGCKTQEDHKKTIPLCYCHHMADQQNAPRPEYVSRHPNKYRFEAEYGSETELLAATNALLIKGELSE